MAHRSLSRTAHRAYKAHSTVCRETGAARLQKLLPFLIASAFVTAGFLFLCATGL